jgi:hypothetical protein
MRRDKLQVSDLLIRDTASKNPFAAKPDQGVISNFTPDYSTLRRVTYMPPFHDPAANSAVRIWEIIDFQFQRDNARNQQCLIFKANGKIYKRVAGTELEIFPGKTSYAILARKPSIVNLADRLHVSDGSQYLIYDGWDWVKGGLDAPTNLSCSLVGGGSLTGTYKITTTSVRMRNGVRIHESSHSEIITNTPAAQNIRVAIPICDAESTHWSIYMSELSTSDVYRRVATVEIHTLTQDISAIPASTSPTAPIRNDRVQPSTVLSLWKNRIAMRDEQALSNLWFTAFAEVKGLLNGAPEECLPGRGPASISDLANSWTIPDSGEPINGCVWHEEFLWVFSDRNGYVIKGEGSLLDDRGLRDFFPQHIFTFGVSTPWGLLSTPFGLVAFSPQHKLWLWDGATDAMDIGTDIQTTLNTLSNQCLSEFNFYYWEGGGATWLIVPLYDASGNGSLAIFDFSVRTADSPKGVWFTIEGLPAFPTAVGSYFINGQTSLLVGLNNGQILQMDNDAMRSIGTRQPAHLNLSMILGSTYLGATPQNSPNAKLRTGAFPMAPGKWVEAQYIEIVHRGTGDNSDTGLRGIVPTVTVINDEIDPDNPSGASGIPLTLNPISSTNPALAITEKRGWLSCGAGQSAAGRLGKRFQVQLDYTATANDGQTRAQTINDEINQLGLAWITMGDLTL